MYDSVGGLCMIVWGLCMIVWGTMYDSVGGYV